MKKQTNHIISTSFAVAQEDVNNKGQLSLCKIFSMITDLNDQMLLRVFGRLDFNNLQIKHYSVNIAGTAVSEQRVAIYAYALQQANEEYAIHLAAKNNHKTIFSGKFLFAM
jgi:hypothetical protein